MPSPDWGVTATGAALRLPLLPFDVLLDWTRDTTAAGSSSDDLGEALAADRDQLSARLSRLFDDAYLQAGLRLAAPAVYDEWQRWRREGGRPSARLQRTLVSYLSRAGARATPFGMFAACGALRLAPTSHLTTGDPEARPRLSRLDYGLQEAMVRSLLNQPEVRDQAVVRPNNTIYEVSGRLRYAVSSVDSQGLRRHHLAATTCSRPLEVALELAASGLIAADLTDRLMRTLINEGFSVTEADVAHFVVGMIEQQILVPSVAPVVTGPPSPSAVAGLPEVPQARSTRELLATLDVALREADDGKLAELPDRMGQVELIVGKTSQALHRAQLVRVDTGLAGDRLTLSRAVADDLAQVIRLAAGLSSRHESDLSAFRERFRARYEWASCSFLEALDAESGVGYGSRGPATAALSPLLAAISFATPEKIDEFGPRDRARLALLTKALLDESDTISLGRAELEALRDEEANLPEAFHVFGTLCAPSAEAIDTGSYTFLLKGVDGPAGASLLGRFAGLDQGLLNLVREQVAVEEKLHPERIYAEVVHLPEGRTGNVIARPHLRKHEITFLGVSGLPPEQQITLSELSISVVGERIVLRSERLGREVVPRLTTAHNFEHGSLHWYRFLCDLQYQDTDACCGWTWGPLRAAPFLPRVTLGRIILSRACWRLDQTDVKAVLAPRGLTRRWLALQDLRQRRRLPRWVVLGEDDHELVLDLDNVSCVEVLLGRMRVDAATTLVELFPAPDDLCVRDEAGRRFVHELVVTCAATGAAPTSAQPPTAPPVPPPSAPPMTQPVDRRFPPGSPWLYLKLYGGEALADDVLTGPLADLTSDLLEDRTIVDWWFFLRYRDDDPHLRIRWHARAGEWSDVVLRRLREITDTALDQGFLHRVEVGTYEREVERYGGPSGIELAEQIFCIDSAAVTAVLRLENGEALAVLRGRAATLGTDRLLADLGLSYEQRLDWASATADALRKEFGGGTDLAKSLGRSFRDRRAELTALLNDEGSDGLADVLAERSTRLSPVVATLRARADRGLLSCSMADLAGSLVHMYLNRLMRSDQRASEMVVADWLCRIYRARLATAPDD